MDAHAIIARLSVQLEDAEQQVAEVEAAMRLMFRGALDTANEMARLKSVIVDLEAELARRDAANGNAGGTDA